MDFLIHRILVGWIITWKCLISAWYQKIGIPIYCCCTYIIAYFIMISFTIIPLRIFVTKHNIQFQISSRTISFWLKQKYFIWHLWTVHSTSSLLTHNSCCILCIITKSRWVFNMGIIWIVLVISCRKIPPYFIRARIRIKYLKWWNELPLTNFDKWSFTSS